MARRHVQKYLSGRHLQRALTDNPELPAFVPTLPAASLKTLIDEIGRHDAGALIEYSTPQQLSTIVDDAIWKSPAPGTPDRFDAAEFLDWLEVILEIGDGFAVERLHAMDEDLLVMAINGLLAIVDLDKKVLNSSTDDVFVPDEFTVDMKELYGSFEVRPRRYDDWDTVQPLLAALHVNEPEFLQSLLTRCCLPESLIRFRDDQSAAADAAGRHRDRREQEGFVSPETAGAFLDAAMTSGFATLVEATQYDLDTRDYFRRAAKHAMQEATSDDRSLRLTHGDTVAEDAEERAPDPVRLRQLEDLVQAVELDALFAPVQRLTGPSDNGTAMNPLQTELARLASEHPDDLSQRLSEAAYLSNVLMVGARLAGEEISHRDSVAAVMATCNLGYEFAPDFDLKKEPGLIGVFRVGWHVVQRLPGEVLQWLSRALTTENVRERLGIRAWMAADVVKAITGSQLKADLELRRFEPIHDILHMLSLIIEEHAVEHLIRLIDHFPTTVEPGDELHISLQRRFIESKDDLAEVRRFLEAIPDYLRY